MGRNIVAKALIPAIILAIVIAVTSTSVIGQTDNTELAQLRLRLALQYLEPEPHLAIAKYFWARGDRLQAFYLLEYARRARFPAKRFDLAFAKAFSSPQGQDQRGLAVFNKGTELQRAGNLKEAEEHLLDDVDLRKRGLAAYIAAHLWKQESYPILQQMLREKAQLLRFDALSALAIDDSSAARRIVREHRRYESYPTLLELIDKVPAR